MEIDAILWDYDGTLVNSVPKNMAITKEILSSIAPRFTEKNLPHHLESEDSYHRANHQSKNWQDLYLNFYGLTEKEMLAAGILWTEYQLKNATPVKLYEEIAQTISQIHIPQGICSQNSSENINQVLEKNNLAHKFHAIIGYDDIPNHAQKPHPFAGLKCLSQIFSEISGKTIFYIGDHEGDVEFARNIYKDLNGTCQVLSVVVKYSGADTKTWQHKPDFEIENPLQLLDIIQDHR